MKKIRILSLALVVAILLAACGGNTNTPASNSRPSGSGGGTASVSPPSVAPTPPPVERPRFINIGGREFSTDLKELDLSNRGLLSPDLEPLEHMHDLEVLNLSRNEFADLSVLESLPNLKSLNLSDNPQIANLSPLATIPKLTELIADGINDNQLRSIVNLTNLTILSLSGRELTDISPLSNITNLTILNLRGGRITDISPLANLVNLKNLHLTMSSDEFDFSPLYDLPYLETLAITFLAPAPASRIGGWASLLEELREVMPNVDIQQR